MTDEASSVHADLAFLRDLVDEDQRPGLWALGALYLVIGAAIALHVLFSMATSPGSLLPLGGPAAVTVYVVFYGMVTAAVFWIGARVRRLGGRPPAQSGVRSRAAGLALAGALWAHVAMVGVFAIVAARLRDGIVMELSPLALFALQSTVWFVLSAIDRRRGTFVVAWGWLAAALALAPLVGTALFGPGLIAAVVLLMIVPGAYMMRAAGKLA